VVRPALVLVEIIDPAFELHALHLFIDVKCHGLTARQVITKAGVVTEILPGSPTAHQGTA
jgi:hypothetical protein